MSKALVPAALLLGGLLTWFDARPGNDDSGISAGLVLLLSACFGFLGPRRPWLLALLLAGGIPLVGIVRDGNPGALMALGIAMVGAYGGMAVRRMTESTRS